ncbi:molybdopterin-binding protein [Oxynema sp. CENA135]|uniref:molybdopterin-binding protein n=1 Tax=Oxynema sp. CENA135 TaxID=984206 RepID=UPI00190B7DC9|nr:molybdopterin-binding protein [Oxynema sp. CENA135]MBK4732048.1 molybdopterin-binding protein [Oxynema sp. CENA135]
MQWHLNPLKGILWLFVIPTFAFLSGCHDRPSERQLNEWQHEAIRENAQLVALYGNGDTIGDWEFVVEGQIRQGRLRFNWAELDALATKHIRTTDPHYTPDLNAVLDFRGIVIGDLLDRLQIEGETNEITFVSFDSFRATISIADIKRYPIALALERDRKPIPRSEAGPLYLIFPQEQYPKLAQKYTEQSWVFYVTHAIVGTEPIDVRLGDRHFDAARLEQLPQTTLYERVGYKAHWPSEKVKLHGVRLQEAIAAAGLNVPPGGSVVVRGKAAVDRDPGNPIRLDARNVRDCDILLATHWGEDREPIPARLGGPVTLAFPSTCRDRTTGEERPYPTQQPWVTFVEEIDIHQPENPLQS